MTKTRLSVSVDLIKNATDDDLIALDTKHRDTFLRDAANAKVRVTEEDCLAWWPRARG